MKQTEVSKQLTKENKRNRREGLGRVLALSRQIYRFQHMSNNSNDTYYVESESCNNKYYFVRFEPSVFEWCSCKDFESNRTERCKHLYGVEYAIRFNTIQEVDKLPEEVRGGKKEKETSQHLSYEEDTYSF